MTYRQIDVLFGSDNSNLYKADDIGAMLVIRELLQLIADFYNHQIPFISLKGPVLSQRIYNDATVRKSHDLDFLVDFNDIDKIHSILILQGYKTDVQYHPQQTNRRHLFFQYKHLKFYHPQKKFVLEFHWRLFTYDVFIKSDTKAFIEKFTVDTEFYGKSVKVLKPEFELLYLTVHGATHKWSALKWLADTNQYLKNVQFDKDEFNLLVKEFRADRILGLYNLIAKRFMHYPEYFDVKAPVPGYLFAECIKAIDNVVFQDENFNDIVSRSLNKLKYQFLLIPHYGRRFFLIRKYVLRDLRFRKIKDLLKRKRIPRG